MTHQQFLLTLLTIWFFASLVVMLALAGALLHFAGPTLRHHFFRSWWWRLFSWMRWSIWANNENRLHCVRCWQTWHLDRWMPKRWQWALCEQHATQRYAYRVDYVLREPLIHAQLAASIVGVERGGQ